MKVIDLLKRLINLNISLEVVDNQLVIEVEKGVVCEEILTEIRKKKFEIIEHLDLYPESGTFPMFDTMVLLENIHDIVIMEHIKTNMLFLFLGKYSMIIYFRRLWHEKK